MFSPGDIRNPEPGKRLTLVLATVFGGISPDWAICWSCLTPGDPTCKICSLWDARTGATRGDL